LPNVGPYIYDVSISGFTRSSIYIYEIISLRVNRVCVSGQKGQYYTLIHEDSAFYNLTGSNIHRNSRLSINTTDLKCEVPAAHPESRLS